MGPDADLTRKEIAKFSVRDAERYPKYEAMLERVADVIEPTLTMSPPDLLKPRLRDLWTLFSLGRSFRRLGTGAGEAVEILTGAARTILDRWFESEELKATLATDAIIGAMASPSMPGTAYVLFHHVMGETNGKRGVWGYVRGGMGGLTQALAAAARDLGVDDPLRGRGGAHPRARRRGRRRGAGRRRGVPRADRGQQRRCARDVPAPARPRALPDGFRGGGGAHRLRERLAQDQRGPVRAAELPGAAGRRDPARSTAARSTSVPTRTTSSAPTTTPSTAGPRRVRSWNARFPRSSTRRWRRRAST